VIEERSQTRKVLGGAMENREFIGEVQLRNQRRVFSEGGNFVVEQLDRHGGSHLEPVTGEVVSWLHNVLRGRTVTRLEVADVLSRPGAPDLPYYGGFKFGFFAQEAMVVLVALDIASIRKVGNRFEYSVGP